MIPNPNQLTAELRSMTDAQLQQYAQMHKNDPYILPMALSESNARKMMRMQAQAQQFQPQPTERDKALMSMQESLPEEVGIGALPERSLTGMADGGIVGYADGGGMMMGDGYNMAVGYEPNRTPAMSYADGGYIERYAKGGLDQYAGIIREEARRQGMDPDLAIRLFTAESGGDPEAVSPKGAVGMGQLMPAAAKEMGLDPKERTDPVKNIRASIGYFLKQQQKYKDPVLAAAAYNWGPANLDKHLEKNKGQLTPSGLPKETADYLTKLAPGREAQAAETAARAPAQTPPAPPTPTQGGVFSNFGKGLASLADVAMSPVPWAIKQAGYAVSRPFLSPAEAEKLSSETAAPFQDMVGKIFGITGDPAYQQEASRRLSNFIGEHINEGAAGIAKRLNISESDASNLVNTALFAAPKVATGVGKVPTAGRAVAEKIFPEKGKLTPQQIDQMRKEAAAAQIDTAKREAAGAGATLEEQAGLAQMIEARQQREAPSVAYEMQQRAAANAPGRVATGASKVAEQTRAADILSRPGEPDQLVPDTSYDRAERAKFQRQAEMRRAEEQAANLDKDEKKQIIAAAKEAVPEGKKQGWTAEDWIQLGLGLMAGKSQYALENLGAAGLGVLKAKQEARKEEREDVYRRALAKKAEAEAGYISEGTKGATAALQNARQLLAGWEKTNANLALLDSQRYETERQAAWEKALRDSYMALGLELPAGVSSATSALPAVPQGVKVRQIGG